MAETAMLNGKFPPQQEAFNAFMASWTRPIRESLEDTEGGGYLYGGMQPGFWNDGAHGVITVKPGARTQYVHVVTRPSTNLVRLPDNGYRVTGVSDLRTGKPMRFAQSGGYLSILDITDWDAYDTVFKMDTAGQQYFYDKSTIRATASANGQSAANLVDGSYENYWDAGGQQPVSVTLDLGRRRSTAYLAIHEREASPTYARESFGRPEDSARIKDYRVHASDDGKTWRIVRTGALPSTRGVQFVDLGEVHARYLQLEVLNTWSGPQAKAFYRQLALDEIDVAYGYPDPRGEVPLEAESWRNGFEGKASPVWCEACSGTAAVTGLGRGAVVFRDVQAAGPSRLQLDTTGPGTLSVSVNGAAPITVGAPGAVAVPLIAGANTIKVSGTTGLDRIAVAPLPPESSTPKTTLTVQPAGVQWVSPGTQSMRITASLRLDVDDPIDQVTLAPVVPSGWTVTGGPVTASVLGLGQVLSGSWTVTAPDAQDVTIPVTASFRTLGRAKSVSRPVVVKPLPPGRVFMREAEDSANDIGDAGVTNCAACSGGQKVRNIGPGAAVTFPAVTAEAGPHTLYLDYTVNGDRSYFVSVNGGPPVEVKVSGAGNNTPYTTAVPVTLTAGANTIRIGNDRAGAPDLDRISLG
jgi:hypothetical protein